MSVQAPNAERQIWILTQMLRIREFETRVKRAFTDHPGVIRGHTHLADGAEASIVGSLAHFRKGDAALATYRCHGYPLTLGTDSKAMMATVPFVVYGVFRYLLLLQRRDLGEEPENVLLTDPPLLLTIAAWAATSAAILAFTA